MSEHVRRVDPRVTVLMPMYDGAQYVGRAIDSVLAQTFRDLELLIVDDASRDASVEVVKHYADARIRLVRNERNIGQVGATNRGLREARGEYIARLDQDDVLLPNCLEREVAVLDAEPSVAVVGSWFEHVAAGGRVLATIDAPMRDFVEFLCAVLVNRVPLAHSGVMYRRGEVIALGGYDETFRLSEDQHLWRQFALRRREARVVPAVLLRYLVHTGSQSSRRTDEQRGNNRRSYELFVAEFADDGAAAAGWALEAIERSLPSDTRQFTAALERLVAGARSRFELAEAEATQLDRLLRRFVFRSARRSWRAPAPDFRRSAPALAEFGLAAEPAPARIVARTTFWAAFAAAPALRALQRSRRWARNRRRYHGAHG